MTTKPFKKVVENDVAKSEKKESIKPFKKEVSDEFTFEESVYCDFESIDKSEIKASFIKKSIKFFSGLSGIFTALAFFIIIAIIADTIQTVNNIITSSTFAEYIYLGGLLFLLLVLFLNIFSFIKQLKQLKSSQRIKEEFKSQKSKPTEKIVTLANILFEHYKNSSDKDLLCKIDEVKNKINNSVVYEDIYNELDNSVLSVLDKKAKQKIHNASVQVALSTAISPVPLVDMVLIVWRSTMLTKDIAAIYGYKPGAFTTILLLKQGAMNALFAGVTELATDLLSDVTSSSFISKISYSAGQGIANGILMARLGYGVMEACRPISSKDKRRSFFKTIIASMVESFNFSEQKGK